VCVEPSEGLVRKKIAETSREKRGRERERESEREREKKKEIS